MEQRLSWEAIRSSASREIPRINQLLGKVLRDFSAIYMAKSVIWMFVLILSSLWNLPLWTTLILGWWMNRQVKHETASFKCWRGPLFYSRKQFLLSSLSEKKCAQISTQTPRDTDKVHAQHGVGATYWIIKSGVDSFEMDSLRLTYGSILDLLHEILEWFCW